MYAKIAPKEPLSGVLGTHTYIMNGSMCDILTTLLALN